MISGIFYGNNALYKDPRLLLILCTVDCAMMRHLLCPVASQEIFGFIIRL